MKSAIKKTLLVTTYFPPQIGGAESYLYNVYSRLEASKIFVLAQQKNNSLEQEFDAKQSFKIYRTSFFDGKLKPSWLSMIKKVAKLIRDKNIETMHFGHYAHYVLIARILKMPYSVYFHGTDLKNYSCNIWQKAFMRFNLKKASTIITSSNFLKNKVLKIYNKPDKIQVVTPGINFSEFKLPEPKEMLRKKYNVDSNTKVIVSSGHLIKNKAFDRGVRAVARLIKNGHNVHYFILGEGIEKDNLVALAQELNIRDKVTIHVIKDRQKYAEYLKIADLYLGTSINEGFGIVFLEARASSLPIVAIDVGGVAEAAGETAILIKEDKLDDLVKKIEIGFSSQISNIDVSFDWNDKLAKFKKVLYNS